MGDSTGTAQGRFGGDKDVGLVFVFAEQGKVEQNFQRFGVGGQHYKFRDATVQGFGGFVGTFFQLLEVGGLRDQIIDGDTQPMTNNGSV